MILILLAIRTNGTTIDNKREHQNSEFDMLQQEERAKQIDVIANKRGEVSNGIRSAVEEKAVVVQSYGR